MARWEDERGWGYEGDRDRYGEGRYGEEGRDDRWRERWRADERMGSGRQDERGWGRDELRSGERRTYAGRGWDRDRSERGGQGGGRDRDDRWSQGWGRQRDDRGAEGWSSGGREEGRDRWMGGMGGERGGWREGERGRWGEGRRDEGWRGEYDDDRFTSEGGYGRGGGMGMGRGMSGGPYAGMAGGGMTGERGYGRGDWGRGEGRGGGWGREEDRGPFERLGDRMREGWERMTGKGPKGFKRSDERIRDDVCERIARSGVNAENVEVKVEHAEVTFAGEVEHRSDKRMLEDLAEDVFGVEEVHNQTRVRREQQQAGGATAGIPGYQQSQAGQGGQQAQSPGQQGQTGPRTQPGAGTQPGGRH